MTYVHGYHQRESERLHDQAGSTADIIHFDTGYPAGSRVLEAGCGVGAQTVTLARKSPGARIVAVDTSAASLAQAAASLEGAANVEFVQADLFELPFERQSFDHVFVCFVLEHLREPLRALQVLKGMLKPGGSMTVVEGDHGSTYFYPDSKVAYTAIRCQVELQRAAGGNANIGRELYPLLTAAGFDSVRVSPRMVYVDSSKPHLVERFTKKTFTAMVEGVREAAIKGGLVTPEVFDAGIRALYRTAEDDGVFCYTFFKGVGLKPGAGQRADRVVE